MPQIEDKTIIWPACMLMKYCRRKCRAKESVVRGKETEECYFHIVPFGGCVRFERRREEGE